MLRSAALAVLAVALSSGVAAAQPAENYLAFSLSYDLPEPEIENYLAFRIAYDLMEPPPPAPIETRLILRYEMARPAERAERALVEKRRFSIPATWPTLDPRQVELSLYASQGALQVLDLVTTSKALGAGHREGNPLFKSGNISAMAMAKVASVGLHVFAVERMKKTRPKTARWLMIATNAMMFGVVVNNLAVIN